MSRTIDGHTYDGVSTPPEPRSYNFVVAPAAGPPLLLIVPRYLDSVQIEYLRGELSRSPVVLGMPSGSVLFQAVEGGWEVLHDTLS